MTIHYNKHIYKTRRQDLRNNPTEAEIILWSFLKHKKLHGYKFRRQYGVDQFVFDFYCCQLKLAVELDGGIHFKNDVKIHDENRDAYLGKFGIEILRISNDEVFNNPESVLRKIYDRIIKMTTPLPPP